MTAGSRARLWHRLLELTEGWATGLYLAVLAGACGGDGGSLGRVHGSQRDIASYLTAEVLERQPSDVRRFLLETSILDRFSPSLARTVTARDDAGPLLARLACANLFLSPLDERDEWYRYHQLFGELLRVELERRKPRELAGLHARAAAWHHAHGDDERAVRHWVAAGDLESAAEPAFMMCQELVDRGQVERARRLLDQFSDEQLSAHFPLMMAAAWLYGTVIGEPGRGERWIRAACSAPAHECQMADGSGTWRAFQLGLRALLAPQGITQMLQDARDSMEEDVWGDDPSEAKRVLGVASYLAGHERRAEQLFTDVVRESESAPIRAYALAFLALLASDQRRWDEAAAYERRATEECPEMTLDLTPGMYLATPMLLARVTVLAHAGDAATVAERARTARHLAEMVPQAPWRLILGAVVLGEVAITQGDLADAELRARHAERLLSDFTDAGMLAGRARRLRQAVEQLRLADPLTAAEQRVLDLLPTHLTVPQIAARLFVTRNTVKSHMSRLYAKLGVTTRLDAVERARELRLIRPGDQA